MGNWHDAGNGHRFQILPAEPGLFTLLWEHPCVQPYLHDDGTPVESHMISSRPGARWTATPDLTLSPSVHCDKQYGGCGMHGWIVQGKYQ